MELEYTNYDKNKFEETFKFLKKFVELDIVIDESLNIHSNSFEYLRSNTALGSLVNELNILKSEDIEASYDSTTKFINLNISFEFDEYKDAFNKLADAENVLSIPRVIELTQWFENEDDFNHKMILINKLIEYIKAYHA